MQSIVLKFLNQPAPEGKPAIQAALEGFFQQNAAGIKHNPQETRVAGDRAYELANITEIVTPIPGKAIGELLKYFVILKRQPDGSLKVHLDMDNSNLKE